MTELRGTSAGTSNGYLGNALKLTRMRFPAHLVKSRVNHQDKPTNRGIRNGRTPGKTFPMQARQEFFSGGAEDVSIGIE